jgi:hypothetical protein
LTKKNNEAEDKKERRCNDENQAYLKDKTLR